MVDLPSISKFAMYLFKDENLTDVHVKVFINASKYGFSQHERSQRYRSISSTPTVGQVKVEFRSTGLAL